MSISQEELDSAYAADADRLNDQLRLALESSPPPRMLALEPNELAQLADDDYEGILGLGDDEEGDGFSEECLRQAELALDDRLYRFWDVL